MADALQNARNRRDELLKELEEIELFLKLHRRYAGTKPENLGAMIASMQPPQRVVSTAPPSAVGSGGDTYTPDEMAELDRVIRTTRPRGRPGDFVRIMESVLKDAQRPLSRGEMAYELLKRGHEIPSDDKARYLGTILWRNADIFENIEGRGYWLKGRPVPELPVFGYEVDLSLGIKR